jgi:hypothetical protein
MAVLVAIAVGTDGYCVSVSLSEMVPLSELAVATIA